MTAFISSLSDILLGLVRLHRSQPATWHAEPRSSLRYLPLKEVPLNSRIPLPIKFAFRVALLVLSGSVLFFGAETYQKPPKEIMDILNAPATPTLTLSPSRAYAMQGSPVRYPPIAELSEPMLRLAGVRINPKTNGLHNDTFNTDLTIRKIPEGTEIKVAVPLNSRLSLPRWSPDGSHFAFTNATANGTDLWVGDSATGRAHKVGNVKTNEVLSGGGGGRGGGPRGPVQWMPDGKSLLVFMVKPNRGAPPPESAAPTGPHIQESLGGGRGVVTHEDMLQSEHDEDLFEYYATSQLAVVDSVTAQATLIGKPGLLESAQISPDGNNFIATSIHRPFSYVYQARQFPTEIEVWDRTGKMLHKLASVPLGAGARGGGGGATTPAGATPPAGANGAAAADNPDDTPQNGQRTAVWRPGEPATLMWVEGTGGGGRGGRGGGRAGNGGDAAGANAGANGRANATPAPVHQKVMALKAPFSGEPQVIFEADRQLNGIQFTENLHTALIDAGGGNGGRGGGGGGARGNGRNATTAYLIDFSNPKEPPKPLWSRGGTDRYNQPGSPMQKSLANGDQVVILDGDSVFLTGNGPSATGDHPFLSKYNMVTKENKVLFKCDSEHYEVADALLDPHGDNFLTRRESPLEPPNYYVRTATGNMTALTHFPDPQPIMRKVHKELVTYKRPDGVEMSFTLYLPPDYKAGTRLPTVVWAYPREYEDEDAASAVSTAGSQQRFTEIGGYSEIFFALEGYAVLDNASMPIVGSARTVNDHFIDQLKMDAKAAVDKAVEMGVTDPDRVGVGGHSYGAFMTDNLLAWTDLFRAGIAESGAPNRTLTPFGFQNERRTIWEAPETYLRMSPFMYADKIKAPLLLIHGEADDNDGTFPIQSERMYEAVRGNGGTVRLVFLPAEAHGYRGKETIGHVNWEKITWFERYVKEAPPRNNKGTEQSPPVSPQR
jgi:dipeptidyl aminopeptidase/acylaminoacyl peptidase